MNTETIDNEILLVRMDKDLRALATTLNRREARMLVSTYYNMQRNRIRAGQQVDASKEAKSGHAVLDWFESKSDTLENQAKAALQAFAQNDPMGRWAMKVRGIGPVIAAGLCAHFDFEPWHCLSQSPRYQCDHDHPCNEKCGFIKVDTVGKLWRFAGLDPTRKWEKNGKRPWNAELKNICWKIGESFVKVCNSPDSLYGRIYRERKEWETARNEADCYATQAQQIAKECPRHKQVKTYKAGKLPLGHLHSRAKRYAVKMFLSHWFEQAWWYRYGCEPVKPFALTQAGHGHYVEPEVPIERQPVNRREP